MPPCRKHPIVLPHKLVCEQCWPAICEDDVKQFWHHLALHRSPLAEISPNQDHIPLWIWGDEAQYRENGDQVLLICMGSILDKRKFSIEACYPLSLCRSETWEKADQLFVFVIKSLLVLVSVRHANINYYILYFEKRFWTHQILFCFGR